MNHHKPISATSPMKPADIPAVARLFFKAFRSPGSTPPPDFAAYFKQSFFGAPSYDPAVSSLVHRDQHGQIDSALAAIPMQVAVGDTVMTGRLMANYMTDPSRRTRGGADMVLTLRARLQDFCFSDSANAVSTDHWKAVGGIVLPVQSLDWRLVFRPGLWYLRRLQQRAPKSLRPLLGLLRPALSRWRSKPPQALPTRVMPRDRFIAIAPALVRRFTVRPLWSAPELDWVLTLAEQNRANGPLTIREVINADGIPIGCYLYYARTGGIAEVLNILCLPNQEGAVVAAMLAQLHAQGLAGATGMAQPFLMQALASHKNLTFRPRGAFCISTRHPEIKEAAQRGDIYVGGLFGESWSRLISDFWD